MVLIEWRLLLFFYSFYSFSTSLFFSFFFFVLLPFFSRRNSTRKQSHCSFLDRPSCHVTFSSLTKCRWMDGWMDGIRGAGSSFRRGKCPSVAVVTSLHPPSPLCLWVTNLTTHIPKPSPTHTRTYALFTLPTPTKPPTQQQPPPIATLPHWPALSPKPNRLICDAALAARYRQPLQSLSFIPI